MNQNESVQHKLHEDYFEVVSDTNSTYWKKANTHDPSIIHAKDGYYYSYSTDAQKGSLIVKGTHVRRSKDLINWEFVGSGIKELPQDALKHNGADSVWAPQVIYMNGEYYMYYCTSHYSQKLSYIGVAVSKKPEGPFVHKGKILTCVPKDDVNAIDPNVSFDVNGNLWMVYGSFFGGIYILPLDKKTGLCPEGNTGFGKKIAGGKHTPYEGPCIIQHGDYYYLFLSCGDLSCDYSVRVARCPVSEGIDGKYLDFEGNDVNNTNSRFCRDSGPKVLGAFSFEKNGLRAPGGQHVIQDEDKFFIAHHTRTNFKESYFFYLNIREIFFSDDGWPIVCIDEYTGEAPIAVSNTEIPGKWKCIHSVRSSKTGPIKNFEGKRLVSKNLADGNETLPAEYIFNSDGTIEGENITGNWIYDNNTIIVILRDEKEAITFKGKISHEYDVLNDKKVISINTFGTDGNYLYCHKDN